MKIFSSIFISISLLFSNNIITQDTTNNTKIFGHASSYKNCKISLLKYSDYFNYQTEIIQTCIIDSLGKFEFTIKPDNSFLSILQIKNKIGYLYIDSKATEYEVYFPIKNKDDIPKLAKENVQLVYKDFANNELNTLLLDFNLRLDYFLYGDTNKLIRMASQSKEFKDSLDVFKIKIANIYNDNKIKYLHNYIRYSIASIEQLSSSKNNEQTKYYIYNEYLKHFPVLYENDAYMIFFNQFYNEIFKSKDNKIYNNIKTAINDTNSNYIKLNEALANDYYFKKPRIRELAIIKGLGEVFYDINYNRKSIIIILEEIIRDSKYIKHKKIATSMYKTLTRLLIDYEAPNFTLESQKGNTVDLINEKGKYVYINFFSTWNSSSVHQMDLIYDLKELYNNIIFISICVDDKDAYKKYITNHRNYSWNICYYNDDIKLLDNYKVQNLPQYYLINPDKTINQAPAYSPIPDGNNHSIKNTFHYIKTHSKKENNFKIGGKN